MKAFKCDICYKFFEGDVYARLSIELGHIREDDYCICELCYAAINNMISDLTTNRNQDLKS